MVVLLQVLVRRSDWARPPGRGSAAEQLLGARDVGLGDVGGTGHAARHPGGLLLQVVALPGLLAQQLARAGHPEPLARAGVRLVLRHRFLFLISAWDRGGAAHVVLCGSVPSWDCPAKSGCGFVLLACPLTSSAATLRPRSRDPGSRTVRGPSSAPRLALRCARCAPRAPRPRRRPGRLPAPPWRPA